MQLSRFARDRLHAVPDEGGQVLAITAVFLVVLILVAAWVLDQAVWYTHHTHLQTQADAAALAAAQDFQYPCPTPGPLASSEAPNSTMINTVHEYDGTSGDGGAGPTEPPNYNGPGSTANGQVWSTPIAATTYSATGHNLFSVVNQQNFENQPGNPNDSFTYNGDPCNDGNIDVKLTETNVPSVIPFLTPSYINAQARVQIQQQSESGNLVPFAVQTNDPNAAEAFFINEDNGDQISGAPVVTLTDQSTSNSLGQEVWASGAFSLTIPSSTPDIGVIIALAQSSSDLTATMTSTCTTAGVFCFDQSPGPSLLHIHTYTTGAGGQPGSGTEPHIEDVQLLTLTPGTVTPAPCNDAYFSDAEDINSGTPTACSVGIAAKIDVGSTPNPAGMTVTAKIGSQTTSLCYQTSGTYSGYWESVAPGITSCTGSGALTVPAAKQDGTTSNSNEVDLTVTCTKMTGGCTNNGTSDGSNDAGLKDVQRSYAADESTSGQVGSLALAQGGVDSNSFEACDAHDSNVCTYSGLSFTMGVEELTNREVGGGTPITLHLQTGSSSSTSGLIQCPPDNGGSGIRTSLMDGCGGSFVINGSAQDPHGSDPNCTYIGQMPTPPSDCIASEPGLKTGPVTQGFSYRICGSAANCNGPTQDTDANGNPTGTVAYCPSNWPSSSSTAIDIPSNDSRLISMFITPYASLSSGGPWPIVNFAEFYVVGFPGDGCSSDPSVSGLEVEGYFIKYVAPGGEGNGQQCTQNTFGNCVGVLTK